MITFDDLKPLQKQALEQALELIKNKNGHMTLNGPAGTGKTTLTKFLLERLVKGGEQGIILAAPTHQARKVLSKMSGIQASTIQSVLKIHPNTYEENVIFEQNEVPDLAKCRVLICDECSMYDRKLFDILMNTIPSWCTVIAIGDKYQLRPTELDSQGNGQISPFFYDKRFKQASLEEVVRSNAPIIEIATNIRTGTGWVEELLDNKGQGVHGYTNKGTALKDFMTEYFNNVKTPDDLYNNRVCAYTNKSVNSLNDIIRKNLYHTNVPFIVGEVLVMQEPLMRELKLDGKRFYETIFNNGQLVRIIKTNYTDSVLKAQGVSASQHVKYWELTVETDDEDDEYMKETIKVFSDESELNKFQFFLAKVAGEYKSGNSRAYWSDFWDIKREFTKVKPLPVSTIHKTQGISVDNCFLYTPCIHKADAQLAQQLLYVGVTRARHNLHFV